VSEEVGVETGKGVQLRRRNGLLLLWLLRLLLLLWLSSRPWHSALNGRTKDVQPAGGARLLALEPRSEAGLVEDVVARQLLGGRGQHLLPADNADVVRVGQLLRRRIGVPANEDLEFSVTLANCVSASQ
jgi:hypothetical protein